MQPSTQFKSVRSDMAKTKNSGEKSLSGGGVCDKDLGCSLLDRKSPPEKWRYPGAVIKSVRLPPANPVAGLSHNTVSDVDHN